MVATSSTKNVWSHEVDDGKSLMGSTGGGMSGMEKAAADESCGGGDRKQPPPPPLQPLKCPRCDSNNTKFCYYNNYSLSQPRHFCKACKRYWTRGGTLRNVPVGGGCRKNKRVRRHPPPPVFSSVAANDHPAPAGTVPTLSIHHQHQPQIPDHLVSPFLYGYPGTEPGFDSTRFDHHQHNMGLGFSFSGLLGSVENNPGFGNPPPSSYLAFGSSSSCWSSASSLASLIASRLHYQGGSANNGGGFHGGPFIENFGSGENGKGEVVKMEVENNGGGVSNSNNTHFQMGNLNTCDKNDDDNDNNKNNNGNAINPSSLSWSWFDPSNMGSSVPSIL